MRVKFTWLEIHANRANAKPTSRNARSPAAVSSVCLGFALTLLFGLSGCASNSIHEKQLKSTVEQAQLLSQKQTPGVISGPLGTIGVAVSPKAKSVIRKTTQPDPALPKGEDMPGIAVMSALYGGPLMAAVVPASLGVAAAIEWTMRHTKEGIYHTKTEVRQAKETVRETISNTTVASDLLAETVRALSASYTTRIVPVQNVDDTENSERIKASGIDTLLALDELRIGLIAADRSDMKVQFVMGAAATVIDVSTETVAQREILKYEGRVLHLSEWTANNAQELLQELEKAKLALAEDVVKRVNETTNLQTLDQLANTESSSSQCVSQYCGKYQGELVLRSGRHKTRSPLNLRVDSGGIMSAVSNFEILPCQMGAPALSVDMHGTFEDSLRGECDVGDFGKRYVYAHIRGSTEGHAARVRTHYARGMISYRCAGKSITVKLKAEAREVSGTTSHSNTGQAPLPQHVTTLPYMALIMQTGTGLLTATK